MSEETIAPAVETAPAAIPDSAISTVPVTNDPPETPTAPGGSNTMKKGAEGREGLRKLFEGKQAPVPGSSARQAAEFQKPTESAPAKPAEKKPEGAKPGATLAEKKSFLEEEPPTSWSKEGKSQWAEWKKKAAEEIRTREERIKGLAESESRLKQTLAETTESSKKQHDELAGKLKEAQKYEYAFDIHNDPEFKKKFVEPSTKLYNELGTVLKKFNAEASAVDWDNEIALEKIALEMEKTDKASANIFRRKANELHGIRQEYWQELNNSRANFDTILAEKTKAQENGKIQRTATVEKTLQTIYTEKGEDGNPRWSILTPREVKPGMKPEEAQMIEQHNAYVDQARKSVAWMAEVEDPAERAQIAVAAQIGSALAQERQHLLARITELETELGQVQEVKPSGGERRSTGNRAAPSRPATREKGAGISDAFSKHFGTPNSQ